MCDAALRDDWVVHIFEINAGPGIEGDKETQMVEELEALVEQPSPRLVPPSSSSLCAGMMTGKDKDVGTGGWQFLVQCNPEKMRDAAAKKRSAAATELMVATAYGGGDHDADREPRKQAQQLQFCYVMLPADDQQPVQELTVSLPVNHSSLGDFASGDVLPKVLRDRWEHGEDGSDGVEQFALLRPSDSTRASFTVT